MGSFGRLRDGRAPALWAARWLCLAVALPGCQRESSAPTDAPAGALASIAVPDLNGQTVTPLSVAGKDVTVLIFLAPDCPISNRYATEIARLRQKFSRQANFWVVYPGTNFSLTELRKHRTEYRYGCEALRDPDLRLTKMSQVQVTPEAALWVARKGLVYHGRIDDLFVDFGVEHPKSARHDLEEALEAVMRGQRPPRASARAIGCPIPD